VFRKRKNWGKRCHFKKQSGGEEGTGREEQSGIENIAEKNWGRKKKSGLLLISDVEE
jgi:hypothetical protein